MFFDNYLETVRLLARNLWLVFNYLYIIFEGKGNEQTLDDSVSDRHVSVLDVWNRRRR